MIITSKSPNEQDRKYAAGEFVAEPSGDTYAIGNFHPGKQRTVLLKNNQLCAISRYRQKKWRLLGIHSGHEKMVVAPDAEAVRASWKWDAKFVRGFLLVRGFLVIGESSFAFKNRLKEIEIVRSEAFEFTSTARQFELMIPDSFEPYDEEILLAACDIHMEMGSLRDVS